MHIERFEYVVQVAKTGSLTLAAQNLHITQSAVSQAITSIEKELGVKIFLRERKGAKLTSEGRRIVKLADELLLKYQEIIEVADSYHDELNGELKIAIIPGLTPFLLKNLSGFKRENPKVQFQLSEKGSRDIVNDVIQGKSDIGFIHFYEDLFKDQSELIHEVLLKGKILASVKKDSHLVFKNGITPEELMKEKLVLFRDEPLIEFEKDFTKQFGPLDILFTTNNIETIRSAVSEDIAITIGVDFTLETSPLILSGRTITLPITNYEQPVRLFGWIQCKRNKSALIVSEFINHFKLGLSESNIKNYQY